MTALIVAAGVFALLTVDDDQRDRRSAMEEIDVGSAAAVAQGLLGVQPTRCETGTLAHLRQSFPEGWSPAAIDIAVEEIRAQTAERWVYQLDADDSVECEADVERTEIGVSPDGLVVWSVAVVGNSTIELPPTVTPAGVSAGAPNN